MLIEPVRGAVQRPAPVPGPQIEAFDLEGGLHERAVRQFITDVPADQPDTTAVGPSRRVDGQRASLGLGKKALPSWLMSVLVLTPQPPKTPM